MECDETRLFQPWVIQWQDPVEFEIIPVVASQEVVEAMTPML
ncbi:MAG: DUF3303 domain-containing protein [candidate division KSB1 bacterium]|nr:DUF3303 domain-containing protein [candidate division KSB1 bacterium]MDZ7367973.1 DUF3303 domain-containing protein [candidate division KSB1 bacterium]MDZ7405596.1 DUF3303 domain-containing protein [candidate division KSB1 bacterium]